jgi:hypothetical protein
MLEEELRGLGCKIAGPFTRLDAAIDASRRETLAKPYEPAALGREIKRILGKG